MGNSSAPPVSHSSLDWVRKSLAAAVKPIPLIGPPLASILDNEEVGPNALKLLFALALALLIYPLVLVLAICWLLQSSWFPSTWRQYYSQEVRQSFKIEDATREFTNLEHQRLDYFQMIEMREPATDPQIFTLRVKPFQRIVIRPKLVSVISKDLKKCPLPKRLSKRPLFSLKAGSMEIGPLIQGQTSERIEIDYAQWQKLPRQSDDEVQITLALLDSLSDDVTDQLSCATVFTDVRLAVEVFKNVLTAPAAVAVAGGTR